MRVQNKKFASHQLARKTPAVKNHTTKLAGSVVRFRAASDLEPRNRVPSIDAATLEKIVNDHVLAATFANAVRQGVMADHSFGECFARAISDRRVRLVVEPKPGWSPPPGLREVCRGPDKIQGIHLYYGPRPNEEKSPCDEKGNRNSEPIWYSEGENRAEFREPMQTLITIPEDISLRRSVFSTLTGGGYQTMLASAPFVSIVRFLVNKWVDGKSQFSLELLDLIIKNLTAREKNLMGNSPDHYTCEQMLAHWQKREWITEIQSLSTRDKAFYMAIIRFGGAYKSATCLVLAQKMGGQEVNFGMNTVAFEEIADILAKYPHLPLLQWTNTIGADPWAESNIKNYHWSNRPPAYGPGARQLLNGEVVGKAPERFFWRDMNLGINRAVKAVAYHCGPEVVFVENGASGGALHGLIGDVVVAAEISGNAGVIGPGPCQRILRYEFTNDEQAGNLLELDALEKFSVTNKPPYAQPLRGWGFAQDKIFENQFRIFEKFMFSELRWHEKNPEERKTIAQQLRARRLERYQNFGLHAGYLVETDWKREDLPWKNPPTQESVLSQLVESKAATAQNALRNLKVLLSGQIGAAAEGESDSSDTGFTPGTFIRTLRKFAEEAEGKRKGSVEELYDSARRYAMAAREGGIYNKIRIALGCKTREDRPPPANFSLQKIFLNQMRCPQTGLEFRKLSADMILFGLFGGMVARYQEIPHTWVQMKPGGPIDSIYRKGKIAEMLKKIGQQSIFEGQTSTALIVEDREGQQFLFHCPNYFTGSSAVVTRRVALLVRLAAELGIPFIQVAFSGGMAMFDKTAALMNMANVILNCAEFHEKLPELRKKNPYMGHYLIIPLTSMGGDTASSTAAAMELSWTYLTQPEGVKEPLPCLGGRASIGSPMEGFAGKIVVVDPQLRKYLDEVQNAETLNNCFKGAPLDPQRLMRLKSLAEFAKLFQGAHDARRPQYLEIVRKEGKVAPPFEI